MTTFRGPFSRFLFHLGFILVAFGVNFGTVSCFLFRRFRRFQKKRPFDLDLPISPGCGGGAPRMQSADPMGLSVMKRSCLGGGTPSPTPPGDGPRATAAPLGVFNRLLQTVSKNRNFEPFALNGLACLQSPIWLKKTWTTQHLQRLRYMHYKL